MNDWAGMNNCKGTVAWFQPATKIYEFDMMSETVKIVPQGGFGNITVINRMNNKSEKAFFSLSCIDRNYINNKIEFQLHPDCMCCFSNFYTDKDMIIGPGLPVIVDLHINCSAKYGVQLQCSNVRLATNGNWIKRYSKCKQSMHTMRGTLQ